MTNPTKIKLQIGTYKVEFVAMKTTAPREYDGFGTVHIYPDEIEEKCERVVLVDTEHKTWQVGRYGSGLYSAEDLDGVDHYVQAQLLKLIRGT